VKMTSSNFANVGDCSPVAGLEIGVPQYRCACIDWMRVLIIRDGLLFRRVSKVGYGTFAEVCRWGGRSI